MDALLDPVNLLALLTLTLLEIVLGIDNVIFIAIITDSLPPERRSFARRLGLASRSSAASPWCSGCRGC